MTSLQIIALILTVMGGLTFIMDFIFMASAKETTKVRAASCCLIVVAMCTLCTLVILGIV